MVGQKQFEPVVKDTVHSNTREKHILPRSHNRYINMKHFVTTIATFYIVLPKPSFVLHKTLTYIVSCLQLGSWRTPYQAVCNRLQSLVIVQPSADSLSANHVLRIWINRWHCLLASRDAFANNYSFLWRVHPQSTLPKLHSAKPYQKEPGSE